jgi:hypothetical protein
MEKLKKLLLLFIMLLLALAFPVTSHAATKISAKSVTLIKGQSTTLKVTGTKSKATWSTSKKSVATVSEGKVTAKAKGTATITATVNKKKYSCKVTVETPSISKSKLSLTVGNTSTIKLNGTKQKVTWKSSKPKIASVTNGKIEALAKGETTITATVLKKKYTCKLTVKEKKTTFSASTAKKKISKQIVEVNHSIFVMLESNYDFATDVTAKCIFYNAKGKEITSHLDGVELLEKGHKGVLEFETLSSYSSYEIIYEYTKALDGQDYKSITNKLKLSTVYKRGVYRDNITLTVKNTSNYDNFYCTVVIIFYDENDEIVDIETEVFRTIKAKDTSSEELSLPYDKDTYEDIDYTRYEAYVSYGYYSGL